MSQDHSPEEPSTLRQKLNFLYALGIRGKIVLPYLVLTLIIAVVGTYVVTSLVSSSLDERLTNQLLESGRVVSDGLVGREVEHVESAQAIAFTVGLAEAIRAGDRERVIELAQPAAAVSGIEYLILFDASGREMLRALRQSDGSFEVAEEQTDAQALPIVQQLLESRDPGGLPRRGLGVYLPTQSYYYLTALPVGLNDEMVGAVVVGTSFDTLLEYLHQTSLANIIFYLDGGHAVATTFSVAEPLADTETLLRGLSITPELYEAILLSDQQVTTGENLEVSGRPYRLARGPLWVGSDRLGVFAVALPSQFIVEKGSTSRNTYALIFAAATAGVIVIGYVISQQITRPIGRLVRTSQAVTDGDLDQRTGITGADEIGFLAATFDKMTGSLAERTRALEEALGRMRAILSSIGDGVLLEDLTQRLIPLNTSAEALLKEMPAELITALHGLSAGSRDTQGTGAQWIPWLLESRRLEVGSRVIDAHSAAVRAEDGEYLGTVIVLRDITAEVEAERLKDAFVAHVSHELRTPLTAIKGYGELLLLKSGKTLGEDQGFLKTICRHTDDLIAMINALLDFSEMEAWQKLKLHRQPAQLSQLVEETADEWRPHMDEKNLAFEVKIPAGLPSVDIDARRFRWAIVNLLRNACQYTPEGGRVILRLSEQDGKVILDVEDTGKGIPEQDLQQLFTRFYRGKDVVLGDQRGIGLGLYVTRAIVEAHDGSISVTSKVGVGSTFTIALPALQDS